MLLASTAPSHIFSLAAPYPPARPYFAAPPCALHGQGRAFRSPLMCGLRFAPLLPHSYAVRLGCADPGRKWGPPPDGRPFPSKRASKHETLREKSLICGICSGPPRYYNLIIV
jgi:hypothetical protein